jgi:hypothetical protein
MYLPHLAALLCCLSVYAAYAQTGAAAMHRCTQDGKISYTDQPCPQGAQTTTLAVPPAPPADPASAADLARQAALADQLRQQRESAPRGKSAKSSAPAMRPASTGKSAHVCKEPSAGRRKMPAMPR